VPESCERPLDPHALSGQQFASPLRIHHATVPKHVQGMARREEGWDDRHDALTRRQPPMDVN
jgi:hypothetical protein